MAKPTSSRRWCGFSGSTACRRRRSIAAMRHANRCSRPPDAHPQGQARAGGARSHRSGDLVVRLEAQAELFGGGAAELALANPIAAELSDMRPSLIPGLVAAAQRNVDRGFPDVALFEVGQIFKGDRPEDQLTAATGLRRALAGPTAAAAIGRAAKRSTPSTPRQTRSAFLSRPARPAGDAGRARRTRLVPSRPLRHHPDRSAERTRTFR